MLIGLLFDLALVAIFPLLLLGVLLGAQRLETFVARDARADSSAPGTHSAPEGDG